MSDHPGQTDDAPPPRLAPDPRDPRQFAAAYAYADREVILRHRREGWPLVLELSGVIVELDPWKVPLPAVPGPPSDA